MMARGPYAEHVLGRGPRLRLRAAQPRGGVEAREVLLEHPELSARERPRRVSQRIVEGLLQLGDGDGALGVEEREVVVEHAPRPGPSEAALHVEEEGGIVHLVAAEGAEDADQEVRGRDGVERRPVVGQEAERRVLGGQLRAVEARLADVEGHAVGVAQHRAGRLVEGGAHRLGEGRRARRDEQREAGQVSPRSPCHGYLRSRPTRRNVRFAAARSLPTSTRTWTVRSVVPSKVERSMFRPRTLIRYLPSRCRRTITEVMPSGLEPRPFGY